MTHILALLNKPDGRGTNRCWRGFLFDTIIQSEVEQFMLDVHHSGHYFLCDPDELDRNEVGNMVYRGIWVMESVVHVTRRKVSFCLEGSTQHYFRAKYSITETK